MPKSQKPIVCIKASKSIKEVNLPLFLDPSHVGGVVTGGAHGVDSLAEQWAKANRIEWVCYLPQWRIFGSSAEKARDRDMIHFCDVLLVFADERCEDVSYIIDYAKKVGRKHIVHLIQYKD